MAMVRVSPGVYRDLKDNPLSKPLLSNPYGIGSAPPTVSVSDPQTLYDLQHPDSRWQFASKSAEQEKPKDRIANEIANQGVGQGIKHGINSLWGSGSGAAPAAPIVASGLPAAGTNAAVDAGTAAMGAYNATPIYGANAVSAAAPVAGWGSYVMPGLGLAAGAYGAYNTVKGWGDEKRDVVGSGLSGAGAGAATGAAIGSIVPGIGTLTGALIGGALGGGAGGIGESLFAPSQTKVEDKRWEKLQEAGVTPWGGEFKGTQDPHAGFRKDLDPNFVGMTPSTAAGAAPGSEDFVNNKFAMSRSEGDLTGKDIWGYAAFPEKLGPAYMATTPENREAISNKALELGLVDEHHGTVDINWTPELTAFAEQHLGPAGSGGGGAPRPRASSSSTTPRPQEIPLPVAPVPQPTQPVAAVPAPVSPLPPQPAPITTKDYVQAIIDTYAKNAPKKPEDEPLLANPLSRRMY